MLALLVAIAAGAWRIAGAIRGGPDASTLAGALVVVVAAVCLAGLYMVEPNQSAVLSRASMCGRPMEILR